MFRGVHIAEMRIVAILLVVVAAGIVVYRWNEPKSWQQALAVENPVSVSVGAAGMPSGETHAPEFRASAAAGETVDERADSPWIHGALDLNRATLEDLLALPGIGPVKGQAILDERDRQGRFRRVDDLEAVHGIGPKTIERLAPLVFVVPGDDDPALSELAPAGADVSLSAGEGQFTAVRINSADAAQLEVLSGIGPVMAERILEDRRRNGPYRRPEDLLRVRGIGPVILDQNRDRLRFD